MLQVNSRRERMRQREREQKQVTAQNLLRRNEIDAVYQSSSLWFICVCQLFYFLDLLLISHLTHCVYTACFEPEACVYMHMCVFETRSVQKPGVIVLANVKTHPTCKTIHYKYNMLRLCVGALKMKLSISVTLELISIQLPERNVSLKTHMNTDRDTYTNLVYTACAPHYQHSPEC